MSRIVHREDLEKRSLHIYNLSVRWHAKYIRVPNQGSDTLYSFFFHFHHQILSEMRNILNAQRGWRHCVICDIFVRIINPHRLTSATWSVGSS